MFVDGDGVCRNPLQFTTKADWKLLYCVGFEALTAVVVDALIT
jgi:hypothetical protein